MEVTPVLFQLISLEFFEAVEKMRKAQQDYDASPTNYNKRLKTLKEAKVDGYLSDLKKNGGYQIVKQAPPHPLQINML